MKYLWWFFLTVVLLLVAIFSILNAQKVVLDYFFGQITLPLVIVILLAFVIGALFGLIIGYCKGRCRLTKRPSKVDHHD